MLHHTRILDISRVLAGPLCSMILGDLGADVIKVERPGAGDETRSWGPPFAPDGESAYYLSVNRNKLSVALDLDSPRDRDVLQQLASSADAVVDNFVEGALEKRGIRPAELLQRNARLIWCTISGFGSDSRRPGYDFAVQAESGWMAITGEPDGAPMKIGVALADVMAGKDAAIAILAALASRELATAPTPPESRHLRISLLHSAVSALVNVAQNVLVSGADAPRMGNAHPNLVPYQLFHAADEAMVIAVGSDAQWQHACSVLELDDLARDPSLNSNRGRVASRARVVSAFASRVSTRSAEEWCAALMAVGVPCARVRSVREALGDVVASPVTGIAPLEPGTVRLKPPHLDEHGALIRSEGWAVFETLRGAKTR